MRDVMEGKRGKGPGFGWHYFNYLLIAGGIIVGGVLLVVPYRWYDPKYQETIDAYARAEVYKKAKAAQDLEIAREREELGLIYIEPGTNPFQPDPSPAPAGNSKPAPK